MLNPTWPRNDHHLQINPTCPDQSSTHQATMLGCNLGLVKLCMCHTLHHHLQINFAYPHQGQTHKATRLGCNLVLLLTHWCTFRYVHRQCPCPISHEIGYVSYATLPSAAQPHMPTSKPATVAHQIIRLGCNLVLLVYFRLAMSHRQCSSSPSWAWAASVSCSGPCDINLYTCIFTYLNMCTEM